MSDETVIEEVQPVVVVEPEKPAQKRAPKVSAKETELTALLKEALDKNMIGDKETRIRMRAALSM